MVVMAGLHAQDFTALSFEPASYETEKPPEVVQMQNTVVVETIPVFESNTVSAQDADKLFQQSLTELELKELGLVDIKTDLLDPRQSIRAMTMTHTEAADRLFSVKASTREEAAIFEQITPIIKDYYITHDRKFVAQMDKAVWSKWLKCFDQYKEPVKFVPYELPATRFIFEIRTPKNAAERINLFRELDHFRMLGYGGVVTVWDGRENYRDLAELQSVLKLNGWRIWTSFSTHDYLADSAYIDPNVYAAGLKALARDAEAFLMGWRRTSIHLFIPEDGWTKFTMNSLRAGNPEIAFIGEYYFGYNGTHAEGEWHEYINIPANSNAVLVVNLGFLSVNPQSALRQVRKKIDKLPLISLIQGETAYYLSRNNTRRSKEVNQRIQFLLEDRFLKAGFQVVAALAGDGSNGMYNGQGIDNLCLSKNHVR